MKYDDSSLLPFSVSVSLLLSLVRRLNAARRYGIFCKCTEGSVWEGMLQDGTTNAAWAALLSCKKPISSAWYGDDNGNVSDSTLAFHPSQYQCICVPLAERGHLGECRANSSHGASKGHPEGVALWPGLLALYLPG